MAASGGARNRAGQTKNDRRDAAREKARQLREVQLKRERRNRLLLQGGIIVAVIAVVAVVALVLTSSIRPAGPGPANMASDGITIGANGVAVPTDAIAPNGTPTPVATGSADTISIRTYVDYLCPFCGEFESANADLITELLDGGNATLTVYPVAILDGASQGSRYSSRAANAAACVADSAPDSFLAFHDALFANQPEENTEGLDDEALVGLARDAGAGAGVEECIEDNTFGDWVDAATARFSDAEIPDVDALATDPTTGDPAVGTPLVIVNGQRYTGAADDAQAFATFVLAASQQGDAGATPSPTPTPTPTPSG